jgi:hypothetical protein
MSWWDSVVNSSIGQTISNTWTSSGVESIYEGVSSFLSDAYDTVDRFSNSGLGKVATAGYNYFMDQRKSINKGQRVSAPRGGSSGQALSAAQKADLGVTPRVAAAAQAATRARNGSAISASIQQLAYKRSRAPLINVGDTSISVKPRAK